MSSRGVAGVVVNAGRKLTPLCRAAPEGQDSPGSDSRRLRPARPRRPRRPRTARIRKRSLLGYQRPVGDRPRPESASGVGGRCDDSPARSGSGGSRGTAGSETRCLSSPPIRSSGPSKVPVAYLDSAVATGSRRSGHFVSWMPFTQRDLVRRHARDATSPRILSDLDGDARQLSRNHESMNSPAARDELLAQLVDLLSLPPSEREPEVVTERAVALATRLWQVCEDPESDYDVCRVLGWLAWLRAGRLSSDEENQAAVDQALNLLGPVWQLEPDAVPPSFLADLDLEGVEPPQEPSEMADLGMERLSLSQRDGGPGGIDVAVFALRWATVSTDPGEPGRPGWLSNLSAALRTRWDAPTLVDEAVAAALEAVDTAPDSWPDVSALWFNLAASLSDRYRSRGAPEDLNDAIAARRTGIAEADGRDGRQAMFHGALASSLGRRFDLARDPEDLDEAIQCHTAAVALTALTDPARADRLLARVMAVEHRHKLSRDSAVHLAALIDTAAFAAHELPFGHPARGAVLDSLASAHADRFMQTGDITNLEEAIRVGVLCLEATPTDDPDRALSVSNLAASFADRFDRSGSLADAEEAVRLGQEAVRDLQTPAPPRALALANLGSALASRAEATGSIEDLGAARGHLIEALRIPDLPDSTLAQAHSHLSLVARARFDQSSDSTDLDWAVEEGRLAVRHTPRSDPSRGWRLSNLSGKLRTRAQRFDRIGDLDEAIELSREALRDCPAGHTALPFLHNNLANSHLARHALLSDDHDLVEALAAHDTALTLSPPGSPVEAKVNGSRGMTLLTLFETTGDTASLAKAIAAFEAAAAGTGPRDPLRAQHLVGLGRALMLRRPADVEDFEAAVRAFSEAACEEAAPPRVRAAASRGVAIVLGELGRWPEAVRAYADAIRQFQRVTPRWLPRSDQEHLLIEQTHLGTEAAAACLSAGDPARAVELFDAGRAILFAQALRSRPDLSALGRVRPELAARFEALNGVLGRATSEAADHRGHARDAIAALDYLVLEIRAVPGFEEFLGEPTVADLLPPAEGGAVVAVIVAGHRSDALVLTHGGVRTVALPHLTREVATARANDFLEALATITNPDTDDASAETAEAQLRDTLAWLWDVVTGPVLDDLGFLGEPASGKPLPRVHWCPSGVLGTMPLHAAGHIDGPVGRAVLDRVVSSTVSTLGAVRATARRNSGKLSGSMSDRALVVAMPTTPGAADLPEAAGEATDLTAVLAGHSDVLGVEGPLPTKADVLSRLPGYRWTHFCCHGDNHVLDPSSSRLLLADHVEDPLTVLDLMGARLEAATLAFLSACTTARTGPALPDEPVHLAAASQLAGYRHVVATLWPVADDIGRELARDFYSRLTAHGLDWSASTAAVALHESVRVMRMRFPRHPSLWATHVHFGV